MEAAETERERRVLAHARILRTLIRFLADDRPDILTRLQAAFGAGHNIGEHEQDFSSTEQYGAAFLRSIEPEIQQKNCSN